MKRIRTMILDVSNLAYRAFFSHRGLTTSKGKPTGAVYGFFSMLLAVIKDRRIDEVYATFDCRTRNTWRYHYTIKKRKAGVIKKLYKEGRKKDKEVTREFVPQIDTIREGLMWLGIPIYWCNDLEADDAIALLVRRFSSPDRFVIINSTDMDFLQLLDTNIRLLRGNVLWGPKRVKREFGVEPRQMLDVGALMGDSTDAIEGIRGVGIKTACKMIQRYGSLRDIFDDIDNLAQEDKWVAVLKRNRRRVLVARMLKSLRKPKVYTDNGLREALIDEGLRPIGVDIKGFRGYLKENEIASLTPLQFVKYLGRK